jgi:hypothetical protein
MSSSASPRIAKTRLGVVIIGGGFGDLYAARKLRNRVQVIWEWAWAYFRDQEGARLITGNSDNITPLEFYGEAGGEPKLEIPPAQASIRDHKVS